MKNAMQKLNEIINERGPLMVSINPDLKEIYRLWKAEKKGFRMPLDFASQQKIYTECYMEFCKEYLQKLQDKVGAVKISSSCWELCGQEQICWELAKYAKDLGFFVIGDFNKAEVGFASYNYAKIYLSKESPFDCITVNPYFGTDGVMPFLDIAKENGKGIFVIVKTPNSSSWEVQDVLLEDGRPFHEVVANLVVKWGQYIDPNNGQDYNLVGAVVGTKSYKQAARLRKLMPNTMFLVPEFRIKGTTPNDFINYFDKRGCGAIVNSYSMDVTNVIKEQAELEKAIEYGLFEK